MTTARSQSGTPKAKTIKYDFKTSENDLLAGRYLESDDKIVTMSSKDISFWSADGKLTRHVTTAGTLRAFALSKHHRLLAVNSPFARVLPGYLMENPES